MLYRIHARLGGERSSPTIGGSWRIFISHVIILLLESSIPAFLPLGHDGGKYNLITRPCSSPNLLTYVFAGSP